MTILAIDGKPCYLTNDWVFYLENLNVLVDLVKRMRVTQKEYFRTKCVNFLASAKQLEAQVDEEIKRYKSGGEV